MSTYDIGDAVRLTAEFRDVNGALANPATVELRVQRPDKTTTTVVAGSSSVGIWSAVMVIDQSGTWWYRFAGIGEPTQAGEKKLTVRARVVT